MIEIKEYSEKVKIQESDLLGKSRRSHIALCREMYWFYLNKAQKYTMKHIAYKFNRSQSTISSGIKCVSGLIEMNHFKVSDSIKILDIKNDFIVMKKK